DANALGVVAVGAERRGAGGADPLGSALVPLLLLLEALAQRLEELLEPAERLDLRLLLVGQQPLDLLAQPLGRDLAQQQIRDAFDALDVFAENAVEAVVVGFVL